ncbi:hypothetical protein TcasGA2_TC032594 [Tribolium castaneum]|uniref:Uncharacterized protein n=1 Tax=Tribolium castaneum TaxID=7070 RepID=A0A139WK42_TRICA|nr:hypothetical protein TcasGA2_TC032594 [Tribolium castaneum]
MNESKGMGSYVYLVVLHESKILGESGSDLRSAMG